MLAFNDGAYDVSGVFILPEAFRWLMELNNACVPGFMGRAFSTHNTAVRSHFSHLSFSHPSTYFD